MIFPKMLQAKQYLMESMIFPHNQGYVYVGTSADTSEFAVDAIHWWWQHPDRPRFEREDKLLIQSGCWRQ